MGCGKSKQSVAINDRMLQKGVNGREVRFERFPNEKENPDEITEAKAREEDGEDLNMEMIGEPDDVDTKSRPRPEDVKEGGEMPLLPREEGVEDEALGQKEELEEEKKDETLGEERKGAELEEDKDASPEDGHGESGRLISPDSPDHYFSSRKDDEALEGILSEYDSPLHVEVNKSTQEVPARGELEDRKEAAAAVVAEPKIGAADGGQTDPATMT